MQPGLTVSRTYTSPMCFQDSVDKELMAERSLLDPLPDLKVKGQRIEVFGKGKHCRAAWGSAVAVGSVIHVALELLRRDLLRPLPHRTSP